MNFFKNQKGYALLLVMLLVVLFTILGMGLLTMNINASKQFNLKEEQVQARHLAEMGILHYQEVLEKEVQANTTDLKCAKIEPLLQVVTGDVISDLKYEVVGNSSSGISCTEQSGMLEVKIMSKSEGDLAAEKIITASYFVKNKGAPVPGSGSSTPSPPLVPAKPVTSGSKLINWVDNCSNKNQKSCEEHETIEEFTEVNTITMKKSSLHFKDSLVLEKLVIDGGKEANLKVDKNMYVSNEIDIQNHACIAVGQSLVVKQKFSSKNKMEMVIYRDAYLPKTLESNSPNNDIYVFGNVFLPSDFSLPPKIGGMKIYVRGNVYKVTGSNAVTKIINPFESMTGNRTIVANNLPCATPDLEQPIITPTVPGTAFWELEDDPLIDYK